jgi:hypothetical protein
MLSHQSEDCRSNQVLWFHLGILPIRVVGRIREFEIQLVPSECPLRAWVRARCLPPCLDQRIQVLLGLGPT